MSYQPPCPNCGYSTPPHVSFCPSCGTKLRARRVWLPVALALLVFACGLGLYQYSTAPDLPATIKPQSLVSTPTAPTATPLPSIPQARTAQSPASSRPSQPAPPVVGEEEPARDLAADEDDEETTVYITRTGKKYHRAGCRYLSRSMIPISLEDAQSEGYDACSVCDPPE